MWAQCTKYFLIQKNILFKLMVHTPSLWKFHYLAFWKQKCMTISCHFWDIFALFPSFQIVAFPTNKEFLNIGKSTWWTMVFCYQNCSDLLWGKTVLSIEKNFEICGWRLRICKLFEITRIIYSNSEKSEQFLVTECFSNLFLEFSHL